jgi:hypothetical protein
MAFRWDPLNTDVCSGGATEMAPSEVTGDAKPRLDSEEEDFATSVIDAQVQDRVADDTSEEGEEEEEEEEG